MSGAAGSVRPTTGHLITFEGGEGSGKSTQLAAVAERARAAGLDVVTCREPGGTPLGERLRQALLYTEHPDDTPPTPVAELFVFAAARAQLVADVIQPALADGNLVLCDRFTDSTLAYQHFGRGLELETVQNAALAAGRDVRPNLTVLLELPPAVGLARAAEQNDYIQREPHAFHELVAAGYRTLVEREPERWLVLDGRRPQAELTDEIWRRLQETVGPGEPA